MVRTPIMSRALFIYNLFPRLYPDVQAWTKALDHIAEMGFNTIFLNPFHLTGYSGSLYSVYDYFQYNPRFFRRPEQAEDDMRAFLARCKALKLDVIMDLVANHTAIDSPLVHQHRDWYVSEPNGEVMRPFAMDNGHRVVWGDLAKLDHQQSPDRENLWRYFRKICEHYLALGFTGFRCDAAYQISGGFWPYLIEHTKAKFPHALFLAETLGCSFEDTCRMPHEGFDYIFNAAKWWDFRDPWLTNSYKITRHLAPSVTFPETHDTTRLMTEVNGHQPAFLQRLLFSCFFSKGMMIVSGLEYGFRQKPHCVYTTPADWEHTGIDYSAIIQRALQVKRTLAPLREEGHVEVLSAPHEQVFRMVKHWCGQRVLMLMNRDAYHAQPVHLDNVEHHIQASRVLDMSPQTRIPGYHKAWHTPLQPGEVKIFACEALIN